MARREVQGFWYDSETKQFFESKTAKTPVSAFTFEDHKYINPDNDKIKSGEDEVVFGQPSRDLAPWDTPTEETAKAVFEWAKKVCGWHASLSLRAEGRKDRNFPEWLILGDLVSPDQENGIYESSGISAGRLASSMIRNGSGLQSWTANSLKATLREAGAWLE